MRRRAFLVDGPTRMEWPVTVCLVCSATRKIALAHRLGEVARKSPGPSTDGGLR